MSGGETSTANSDQQLQELRERMRLISDADPSQYHNDYSLKRYLRAFKTVDAAFQAILKTNKWRVEYGVDDLNEDSEPVAKYKNKAQVLKHRDLQGRPIIYIPSKYYSEERDINELTKFIVYCLETACKKCFEEVVDNLLIIFDLADFQIACMDYQLVKNIIWLLSRMYPERLGYCLILNAPAVFSTVWPVIRAWLDENTSKKIIFINSEEELCKYLIPDILPTDV